MKNLYLSNDTTIQLDNENLFDIELIPIKLFDESWEANLCLNFKNKSILLGTYSKQNWFITLEGHCNEYITFGKVMELYGNEIRIKLKKLLHKPIVNKEIDLYRIIRVNTRRFFTQRWKNLHSHQTVLKKLWTT